VKNKIQGSLSKIKEYISKVPKKMRNIILACLAAAILLAVILSAAANSKSVKYTELYTGLSTSEAASIFGVLKDMGADVKVGSEGSIMVPQDEYDMWILQLASMGYPKTALTYDVFSSHAGMTTTESEKAQWLLYQLQDRIQATLERMDGVADATVTITVPETSDYVWETATTEQAASAGVLLTLDPGVSLSGKQVSAIRTLIASSVPKMVEDDVTVVDAGTMLELTPEDGSATETPGDTTWAFSLWYSSRSRKTW
jgi:flagellar biosynthesis/type III secretory pathway M-ring protein FliF/YscJ